MPSARAAALIEPVSRIAPAAAPCRDEALVLAEIDPDADRSMFPRKVVPGF